MNEEIKNQTSVPQDNETPNDVIEPTTADQKGEQFIPVKYNKEIINLNFERAGELAQKGMKFEALSNELELLKQLANDSGKTAYKFLQELKNEKCNSKRNSLIEKCGDDTALADEVNRLYGQNEFDDGFDEVKANFSEIKVREDLPESVLENAKLSGRQLFDEYLRYRFKEEMAIKENILSQQRGKQTSTGSQLNKTRGENPEAAEFLKGLWRK